MTNEHWNLSKIVFDRDGLARTLRSYDVRVAIPVIRESCQIQYRKQKLILASFRKFSEAIESCFVLTSQGAYTFSARPWKHVGKPLMTLLMDWNDILADQSNRDQAMVGLCLYVFSHKFDVGVTHSTTLTSEIEKAVSDLRQRKRRRMEKVVRKVLRQSRYSRAMLVAPVVEWLQRLVNLLTI